MGEVILEEGESLILQGEVETEGGFYTPEEGTITLKIHKVFGNEEVFNESGLSFPLTINLDSFALNAEILITAFKATLTFQCEGLIITKRIYVTVEKSLPILFSKQDAIRTLGLEGNLDAKDVDIHYAYQQVKQTVGTEFMTIANNHSVDNRLVFLKTLIMLIPMYDLRAKQIKKIDDHSETRFRVDTQNLLDRYEAEYNTLLSSTYDISYEIDSLLSLVTTTDVITGEE
ncbi:hypothetical protein [Pseudoalteromonas phage KB12-38]|nr:hypothetical protein [Pseudoalteromonas phage KB12-38]